MSDVEEYTEIKWLSKYSITPELITQANNTFNKMSEIYYPEEFRCESPYTVDLLLSMMDIERALHVCVEMGKESHIFSYTVGTNVYLLLLFPDILMENETCFGVDIVGKHLFYYLHPMRTFLDLINLVGKLPNQGTTELSVPRLQLSNVSSELDELVRHEVSGNYRSKILGKHSDSYEAELHTGEDAVREVTAAISSLGKARADYLRDQGVTNLTEDMSDLSDDFKVWESNTKTGLFCSIIRNKETGLPLSCIFGKRVNNSLLTVDEIIVDMSEEFRFLSLVPIAHILVVHQLKLMCDTSTVLFGYNVHEKMGDYKKLFRAIDFMSITFEKPTETSISRVASYINYTVQAEQ